MESCRARCLLAAVLLGSRVPVLLAQQTPQGAEAPIFDLAGLTASALRSGSDVRAAELSYEQARLQYAQAKAKNGVSLAANALLSHDTADTTAAFNDNSEVGTNIGQAGLTLTLPLTKVEAAVSHLLLEPTLLAPEQLRNTTTGSLSVSQTLWDGIVGGRSRLTLEQARVSLQSRALALASARRDIASRVAQAYVSMLSAQRTVELAAATVEQRTAELDRTRILVESGKAADIDRRQAELNLASARIDQRTASTSLASARAKLALLAGMERELSFSVREIEDPSVPPMELDEAIATAFANRTDLKQLRLSRSSGDIDLRLTTAQRSPLVSASASAGLARDWNRESTDGDWSARLQVSVPILDSGAIRSQIDSRKVQNLSADLQIADLELAIGCELAEAIAAVENARDRLELARLGLEQAELRHELARTKEELGSGSSLDALTASVAVSSAKAALLKARGELHLALLSFRQALGD